MDSPSLKVGQAARAAGISVQTLHYYERRGLIAAPPRTAAGYRVYEPSTVATLRAIKQAQTLGFSLREIQQLMALRERDHAPAELLELTQRKLEQIDEKIALLRRMRDALRATAEACRCGGDVAKCDVLAGFGTTH
ncbi:MAG: heavy metal-responsive transcriptional regulator [Myxococcota bacterium]|nr:heavy metal-responsive transcriptional regulator [Myxococcota bacterium]